MRIDDSQPADEFWRYRPLLWLVVLLFLSFLGWASLSEIDQHVTATGRVVPSGKARTVQHLEGGIVRRIRVTEGQRVRAGDVLYEVANTEVKSRLKEVQLEMVALEARKFRIDAELERAVAIEFPPRLKEEHAEIIRAERALFDANSQQFDESITGLRERLRQRRLALAALSARVDNLAEERALSKRQAAIKEELFAAGAVSEAQYLNAQAAFQKIVTTYDQARNEVPILRAEIIELESSLGEAEKERDARLIDSLQETELRSQTLTERFTALSDEVARSNIVSPIDGTLNTLFINTVGGVIRAGETVAEITPANEALVIEAQISTLDRGKVWPDLPTMTKITAFDFTIYGGVSGELTYISPDSFVDKQNNEHFRVRVSLSESYLSGDADLAIRPGMTAEVSILTGKRSVLAALLKPITQINARAFRET
ncbi:MAG: HlyD family type I secretion periplasmic adaptor subunit [Pseudomonadota bacterium]